MIQTDQKRDSASFRNDVQVVKTQREWNWKKESENQCDRELIPQNSMVANISHATSL